MRQERSTDAVATMPSEFAETDTMEFACADRVKSCSPVKICQTLAVRSEDEEIRNGPNPRNASEVTGAAWPVRTIRQMPLVACQTHILESKLPVAKYSFDESNITAITRNLWPWRAALQNQMKEVKFCEEVWVLV